MKTIKSAVNIITTPAHFKYTHNLIKGLNEKCTDEEATPIFVFFDNPKCLEDFNNKYPELIKLHNISYYQMAEVITKCKCKVEESVEEISARLSKGVRPIPCWGAGGHRWWVSIKRSYSILFLKQFGYDYVWCLDAESMPLKDFSFDEIFENYAKENYSFVSTKGPERKEWEERNRLILCDLLGYDPSDESVQKGIKSAVRQNCFYMVNTDLFKKMVDEISININKPLSYFMVACEMWPYELWLYVNKLKGKIDLKIISIQDEDVKPIGVRLPVYDFHHPPKSEDGLQLPNLIRHVSQMSEPDYTFLADKLNSLYFDRHFCWFGNHAYALKKINPKFFELLNIKVAVSNYQELT